MVSSSSVIGFQFYLSSIKSRLSTGKHLMPQCFNSTLVQLKGFVMAILFLVFTSFNSTLVQLKVNVPPKSTIKARVSILP